MKKSWFLNLIKNSINEKNIKETSDTERVSLSEVEGEIQKLADNSKELAISIKAALKNVRESVSKIKKSSEEVLDRFDEIDSGVGKVE